MHKSNLQIPALSVMYYVSEKIDFTELLLRSQAPALPQLGLFICNKVSSKRLEMKNILK